MIIKSFEQLLFGLAWGQVNSHLILLWVEMEATNNSYAIKKNTNSIE